MRIPRFRTQRVDDSTSKTWSQFLRPSPPEWIRLAIVGLGLTLLVGGGLADHVAVTLQEGNWTVDAQVMTRSVSFKNSGVLPIEVRSIIAPRGIAIRNVSHLGEQVARGDTLTITFEATVSDCAAVNRYDNTFDMEVVPQPVGRAHRVIWDAKVSMSSSELGSVPPTSISPPPTTLLTPAVGLPYRGWVDELFRRTCPEPR